MTVYYVDGASTYEGGPAITPATARKSFQSVYGLAQPGDTILVRRGYYYDAAISQGMPTISKSGITIDVYGLESEPKPCFDALTYELPGATGWSHEGSGVWSKQFGTQTKVNRLFTGANKTGNQIGQRTYGTARRRTPDVGSKATIDNVVSSIIPNLTDPTTLGVDIWYGASATLGYKLYVYTGSVSVSPPDFYNGLALMQQGTGSVGFYSAFMIQNAKNVTIRNIAVNGTPGHAFYVYGTEADLVRASNIHIENCDVTCAFQGGFRVRAVQTSSEIAPDFYVHDVLIRNCTANMNTSALEQEGINTSYSIISGLNDMYSILNKVKNVRIVDCKSIDAGHAGAVMGNQEYDTSIPEESGFERHHVIAADWTTYSRSVTTYKVSNTCYVKDCVFEGTNVRAQFDGAAQVTGNIFKNLRASIRKPGTDGFFVIEAYGGSGTGAFINGVEQKTRIAPMPGLVIANNVFVNCYGTPIELNKYNNTSGNGYPDAEFGEEWCTIANNVFIDMGPNRSGKPFMTTAYSGSLNVPKQIIKNNIIYSATTPIVQFRGTNYSLNSSTTGYSNNISGDPKLSETFEPLKGSPCLGGGTCVGFIRDVLGKPFDTVKPDIGIFAVKKTKQRKIRIS